MAKKISSVASTKTISMRPSAPVVPTAPTVKPVRRNGVSGNGQGHATHEQIAQRAYQLWQLTGNSDEAYNWAEAERQLKAESSAA